MLPSRSESSSLEHTFAPVLRLQPQHPVEYDMPIFAPHNSPFSFHRRSKDELLTSCYPDEDGATRFDSDTMSESVPDEIRGERLEQFAEPVP
jgi:hypothetical protein